MSELITYLNTFIFHADIALKQWFLDYGLWVYFILFVVIFCETGLVVTPFLPGDSLLFTIGMLAHQGYVRFEYVVPLLTIAAILGDSLNYWIGRTLGLRTQEKNSKWLNPKNIERTRLFYERHGGKTVAIGRFIPIIRTYAPFVAGLGNMKYRAFLFYSILGSIAWMGLIVTAGYFLGEIPEVKKYFSLFILLIVFLSIFPILVKPIWSFIIRKKQK